ncbi:MFS transporter [Methanosarcina sp. Z-7115]|uniref:MFS transporter n=1 Tax=Methanosarcina baikalica TaxID=3073890 RepID=A0ABU2D372_9EURY|nr:MFS transporter [Methanosarcina sp. Z-7115]MDR7666440.1 MFS transporter [Methanosarcina sp. Z-7115]
MKKDQESRKQKDGPYPHEGENISLLPLLAVNFIGTLGFSIVLPFLVFLVNRLGGNAFIYGLASSMYPAFQLIGAPLLGRWSDIYGRKKILFLSQLGTLLSWIIFLGALFLPVLTLFKVDSKILGTFAFTLPLAVLFFARAFDGLTGGNVSVANAYLADVTVEKDRNRNFGKMSISSTLGFIVGPALAGILSVTQYGDAAPVLGAIVISLIGTLLIIFYLPENKECSLEKPTATENIQKFFGYEIKACRTTRETRKPTFREVLKLPNIPYMLGLYFIIFLGFNIFYTAFPLHAIAVLNWNIAQMGVYFTVLSALLVIVQGTVLPRASKRYSDATLIIFGSLMLGTNFLLLIPGNLFLTYLSTGFFALGDGLMWPSFLSLLSKIAGRKFQGTVQGLASSFGGLASITGLILGGLLYELLAGASFLIAGLVIYAAFLLNFRLRHFEEETKR